jgi:hypothetical protein
MAVANHDFVLWAVPRFRRVVRPPGADNRRDQIPAGAIALEARVLKTVSEGIAENPEAAACLYGYQWRGAGYPLGVAT